MEIAVVGTGYVGLVAGVCFADAGHMVVCIDKDPSKIEMLRAGKSPIYEPGLEELMAGATRRKRLSFTGDLADSIRQTNMIFIAVGTPEGPTGEPDLSALWSVVDEICRNCNGEKFAVLKSTVPIGTAKLLQKYFDEKTGGKVEVINNPEFLKEGTAVDDFLKPDRVVVGCRSEAGKKIMEEMYDPFTKNGHPILFMDNTSAEMCKYAANSFLSVKISFINQLARLADSLGADINQVRRGFTSDKRINPAFFYPGLGYGGSCFPKDVQALMATGKKNGVPMTLIESADSVNDAQKWYVYDKLKKHFGDLGGKKIAVWGLSFKPRTDDVREAPALHLIERMVKEGATVVAYDPVATENARKYSSTKFETGPDAMAVAQDADALVLMTEWNEFRNPDYNELKRRLKNPVIFDGRNVFDPVRMRKMGFAYYCVGRQALTQKDWNPIDPS